MATNSAIYALINALQRTIRIVRSRTENQGCGIGRVAHRRSQFNAADTIVRNRQYGDLEGRRGVKHAIIRRNAHRGTARLIGQQG